MRFVDDFEITEEEFQRLHILFDTEGIMYTSEILHTEQYPTWAIFDEDMQTILYSTKWEGEVVFYLTPHGKSHVKKLGNFYTCKNGTIMDFS